MASFFIKLKKKWQLVVYVSLLLGAVTFFVSTIIPPKHESEVSILIVQRNIDTFSAARSAEYLGAVFSQVVYTESFLSDVLDSPFEIEKEFSSDPKKKRKQWKNDVSVKVVRNTGIVEVRVLDKSRVQAEKIASGIAWNFAVHGNKYHGGSEDVEVKIIDGPITSAKPAYPNVFTNSLLGLLVGFVGSLVLVFFFDDFDLKLVESRRLSKTIVKDEIERQLEKRSQKEELKYAPYEESIYEIKRAIRNIEPKQEKLHQESIEARRVAEEEIMATEKTTEDKAEEFSSEIEQKKRMVREVGMSEGRGILEKEEVSRIIRKPTKREEEIQQTEDKKINFLTRLYQKSIFADGKISRNREKLIQQDKERQEKLDHAGEEVVESVKKLSISQEDKDTQLPWMGGIRKAPAPDDLPVFVDEKATAVEENTARETEVEKRIESQENVEKFLTGDLEDENSEEKKSANEKIAETDIEPTDDEVKDRLNKLLKGEL